MNSKLSIYFPFLAGFLLAAGIWIGSRFAGGPTGDGSYYAYDKINAVLGIVENRYVDSVDRERLVEETIGHLLQSLDPHSDYFPAEQAQAMNEALQGNFEGIGIEYNMVRDTVTVVNVIRGGPSEKVLMPGDRLVKADGKSLVDKRDEKDIKGLLRGPADTKVLVTVVRRGERKTLDVPITRGSVPIYSIDAAHMLDEKTGYILLSRFASDSHEEFEEQMALLRTKGMKRLVLDLRGNGGGYLETAVKLADEFLPAGRKIVYTEGRASKRRDYDATSEGDAEQLSLAVLIDEYSASASEIIAGAMQDNDRGLIVGRRSFGKGLVQREEMLRDSSAFRITIARYYTPAGRCIQKPYDKGLRAYYNEENERLNRGELFHADSIHFSDSLKFRTLVKKRTVYGGGGIMPDLFVPLDTSRRAQLLEELLEKNVFTHYAFDYADVNRSSWKKAGEEKFYGSFSVSKTQLDDFIAFAQKSGVRIAPELWLRHEGTVRLYLKAYIARVLWSENAFYKVLNSEDPVVRKALEALKE